MKNVIAQVAKVLRSQRSQTVATHIGISDCNVNISLVVPHSGVIKIILFIVIILALRETPKSQTEPFLGAKSVADAIEQTYFVVRVFDE